MPLDGHSYLVSQGWGGKGTALRDGAISRPITVAQKKNLAGLGKDRDEAFPFWDHLFSAAAKSIQIKYISDDEDGSDLSTTAAATLKRTSTGILSTRRPVEGTSAASGSTTPSTDDQPAPESRLSLVAHAKREAAKRGLYSRFFRGPIIGPEAIEAEETRLAALVSKSFDKQNAHVEKMTITEHIEVETEDHERMVVDLEVTRSVKHKKRSHTSKEKAVGVDESDYEEEKRARKKRRKEEKRRKAEEEDAAGIATEHKNKKHKSKSKPKSKDGTETTTISSDLSTSPLKIREDNRTASKTKDKKDKLISKLKSDTTASTVSPDTEMTSPEEGSSTPSVGEKAKESKEERARRKDEKRRLKALQKAESVAGTGDVEPSTYKADDPHSSKSSNREKTSKCSRNHEAVDAAAEISEEPTKKKKRKRTEE